MARSWLKVIGKLKRFLSEVGPLWPDSTNLAGYAESGPYSCENCEYLKGREENQTFKDESGFGRCSQPVMIADPQVKKDEKGRPIVNIERGCCEFVELVKIK